MVGYIQYVLEKREGNRMYIGKINIGDSDNDVPLHIQLLHCC